MIDVLYYPDDITIMYSLYPLIMGRHTAEFRFHSDPDKALASSGSGIILFRMYKRKREGFDLAKYIEKLRQSGKRIAYFDDTADPREIDTDALSACDVYYKKQALIDRSAYRRAVYGKRIITEYYHERFGIDDNDPDWAAAISETDMDKIRVSWNLGIGSYPKTKIRKAIAMRMAGIGLMQPLRHVLRNPGTYRPSHVGKVLRASARFGCSFSRNTISQHRKHFVDQVSRRPDLFLSGRIPLREYNRELRTAAATVSPFGWGEICFRDFEAIINASVLLKPSMGHIETWPEIYQPQKTYIPLDWDALNLVSETESILEDDQRRKALTENSLCVYHDALSRMDERVERILGELAK